MDERATVDWAVPLGCHTARSRVHTNYRRHRRGRHVQRAASSGTSGLRFLGDFLAAGCCVGLKKYARM